MMSIVRDIIALCGLGLIGVGAWKLGPPWLMIVGGAVLLAVAIVWLFRSKANVT